MHSGTFVGLGFLLLGATWAPVLAIGSLLIGGEDKKKTATGMVEKSTARTVKVDVVQKAAQRVNKAKQELEKRQLALEREENYANKTNATVNYLEVRLNIAKRELKEARAIKAEQAKQELKKQELALEREQNFVNGTIETVRYSEARVNSAKKNLKEARGEKKKVAKHNSAVKSKRRKR